MCPFHEVGCVIGPILDRSYTANVDLDLKYIFTSDIAVVLTDW